MSAPAALPRVQTLGLIGCGLMGGSFALALRAAGLVGRVVGYSASASTTARALERGVIDATAASALEAAQGADLVLLALPVAATEATLRAIAPAIHPGMVVMDVGSTKGDVAQAARAGLPDQLAAFVPAHPITGKEVSGVDHADAQLYQGSLVVLTPLPETAPAGVDRAEALWRALGCRVQRMAPEAHDQAFAAVSHLPHLLAFAFMNGVLAQADAPALLSMAGPGFRDFSRIAGGEPRMWRDILIANRDALQTQLQHFQHALHQLEQAMHAPDATALEALLQGASQARSAWRLGGGA